MFVVIVYTTTETATLQDTMSYDMSELSTWQASRRWCRVGRLVRMAVATTMISNSASGSASTSASTSCNS
eukprot:8951910-Heterocapsa_arctica.AAC.1